ncbi:TIGR02206 family membrane protein [Tissierella praeacuta]|uniref:YwaF family protein n=1 Tax=Tissierella praeacuta TaxID=43131 RepID=UPI00334297A6
MKGLKYFFRGSPDGYVFPIWSLTHLIIIIIAFLGVQYILLNKRKFKIPLIRTKFKRLIIAVLSLQQIILYLWYGFSGYGNIRESLPLYNCRIAIIFTVLSLLTDKDIFKNIACYWGLAGSILVIMIPTDVYPFSFPHYTNVSYFIGHIGLLWSTVYFLIVDEYRINKSSLKTILYFTNIYHLLVYIFNIFTNSNYCYLNKSPFANIFFTRFMSPMVYSLMVFLIFNIFMILIYLIAKTIYKVVGVNEELVEFAS